MSWKTPYICQNDYSIHQLLSLRYFSNVTCKLFKCAYLKIPSLSLYHYNKKYKRVNLATCFLLTFHLAHNVMYSYITITIVFFYKFSEEIPAHLASQGGGGCVLVWKRLCMGWMGLSFFVSHTELNFKIFKESFHQTTYPKYQHKFVDFDHFFNIWTQFDPKNKTR